ncbi:ABC transporter permease [Humitalea sp. 24SJ18S-53]|uniref:ABC transporter permease n=1 Tax=Humitalea sp. 24SJ18S-53 TaxID=3422307 RepID=UPI003D67B20D
MPAGGKLGAGAAASARWCGGRAPVSERAATQFSREGTLAAVMATRERVVHALLMRELQTRFGRSNFGFLWLFFEPMMLGGLVGGLHAIQAGGDHDMAGMPGVSIIFFFMVGYVPYFMFRSMIGRAASAIHSNLSLLYHRDVLLVDIMIARNLIEYFAICGVMVTMVTFGAWATGRLPDGPLKLAVALMLMALLSHGISMIIAAGAAVSDFVERIVHPMTYIMMPLSGAFFMVHTLPPQVQDFMLWIPLVNIHELAREGQFGAVVRAQYDLVYVGQWILGSNFLGLMALRVARPRLHMY